MSWDDPSTDMAHCAWCSWDLMKADAGDDHMHPECRVKWNRRNTLREALIPALIELGVTAPDRNNLLTDICRLIEKEHK